MKIIFYVIVIGIVFMGLFSFIKGNSNNIEKNENENFIDNKDYERPDFSDSFNELSSISYDFLNQQQELVEEKYNISSYEKWEYDQESGILNFIDGDIVKIKIYYKEVGSISLKSNTWLWSWANPHTDIKVNSDILIVKEYGEKNNFESLTKRKWLADEADAWEATAISAYLMKAKGAYRFPLDDIHIYVIYKDIIDLR